MPPNLLFKLDIAGDGEKLMTTHRALITQPDNHVYIHVFTWTPTQISIGYNQKIPEEIKNFWIKRGIKIVRRPTGGAAVLHIGDISVAIIIPRTYLPKRTKEAYHKLSQLLASAIEKTSALRLKTTEPTDYRSVPECFASSTGYELATESGKAIGIALRATKTKLLLHASIRIAPHPKWFLDTKKEGWLEGLTPQATLQSLIETFTSHFNLKPAGVFSVRL